MKSIELLQILSKQEQKFLELELKENKKKQLEKTYKAIKKAAKKNVEPNKEKLYKDIFSEEFNSQKDYRLRHELRVLNEFIEDFLIRQQFLNNYKQEEYQSDLRLLKYYIEKKAYNLYEKQWNKTFKQAKIYDCFEQMRELLELNFSVWYAQLREDTNRMLTEMRKSTNEMVNCIENYAIEEFLKAQQLAAFTEAIFKQIQPLREFSLPQVPLVVNKNVEDLPVVGQFFHYIITQYSTTGTPKIEAVKKALALVDEVDKKRTQVNHINSKLSLLGILATEYSVKNDNISANKVYESLLPLAIKEQVQNLPAILYNYMMNSLHLKSYEKVITLYDTYADIMEQMPQLKRITRFCLCWAYVFLAKPDEALAILNTLQLPKLEEKDYYYARMLYIALYCEMENWETANRELTNTYQAMYYKELQNPMFKTQLDCYKWLLKVVMEPNRKVRKEEIILLENNMQQIIMDNPAANSMLLKWIYDYLNRIK